MKFKLEPKNVFLKFSKAWFNYFARVGCLLSLISLMLTGRKPNTSVSTKVISSRRTNILSTSF